VFHQFLGVWNPWWNTRTRSFLNYNFSLCNFMYTRLWCIGLSIISPQDVSDSVVKFLFSFFKCFEPSSKWLCHSWSYPWIWNIIKSKLYSIKFKYYFVKLFGDLCWPNSYTIRPELVTQFKYNTLLTCNLQYLIMYYHIYSFSLLWVVSTVLICSAAFDQNLWAHLKDGHGVGED
jgi:hypothetical protein